MLFMLHALMLFHVVDYSRIDSDLSIISGSSSPSSSRILTSEHAQLLWRGNKSLKEKKKVWDRLGDTFSRKKYLSNELNYKCPKKVYTACYVLDYMNSLIVRNFIDVF
jgi:hypothetical protein